MDLAADTRYHQLREEIDKLGALSGAPVDWRRVEALGADLTLASGPDLNVLAYTALARFKLGGPPRLCEQLAALAPLLAAPELTPPRPKARARALEWLLARLLPELRALAPDPSLQPLAAALRELRGACRLALGDMSPSFGTIVQVADALSAAPPPPPDPSAIPSITRPDPSATPPATQPAPPVVTARPDPSVLPTATQPAPAATPLVTQAAPPVVTAQPAPSALPTAARPDPSVVSPPTDLAALDTFLASTGDALEQAARALRDSSPLDPRAVRLLRVGLWLRTHAAPPLRPDGTTNIPGLSDRDRAQLDELHAHARWPALLARSETLLLTHRLALDLQRHSATALTHLDAAPALHALRAELRSLLARVPALPTLRDRDGRPLADPATARWVQTDITPRPPSAPVPDAPHWPDLPEKLRGPDRADALADAHRQIAASPSEQVRWARRLALAEACERAADPLAVACFRALADDLAIITVERHDPVLAARCLAGLARTARDPSDALARLARLDPPAAAAALAERPPAR
jgi:type VI secretion system ImpA/VasJ family protein